MTFIDSAGLINPTLPQAPEEYDRQYMDLFIQALEENFRAFQQIGLLKGGTLFLRAVPTSGQGLRVGFIYQDGGYLKIVREGDQFPSGLEMASATGTVTILTP